MFIISNQIKQLAKNHDKVNDSLRKKNEENIKLKEEIVELTKSLSCKIQLGETSKNNPIESSKGDEDYNLIIRKLIEVEKERNEFKEKYFEKIEELGKVKIKAEKFRDDFEKYLKKKLEQGTNTVLQLEQKLKETEAELVEVTSKYTDSTLIIDQ